MIHVCNHRVSFRLAGPREIRRVRSCHEQNVTAPHHTNTLHIPQQIENPCPPNSLRNLPPTSRLRVSRRAKRPPPKRPFTSQLSNRLHTNTAVRMLQVIRKGDGQRPAAETPPRHHQRVRKCTQYKPGPSHEQQGSLLSPRFA